MTTNTLVPPPPQAPAEPGGTEPATAAGRLVVPGDLDGRRLDRVLGLAFPGLGARRLRRVFLENEVLVDGVARQPVFKVRAGAVVVWRPLEAMAVRRDAGLLPGVLVLFEGPDYGAVFKPGGLSTASVGPGGGSCLEDRLPELFPGRRAILLGRLDRPTSGIVAVAFDENAAERFREAEDRGLVEKTYLAVVHGLISGPLTVENALDTARRKKTRVLDRPAEPLRHTQVAPLGYDAGTDLSLVRAVIMKGARHQIRAHLASLGHPILGDALYGRAQKEEGPLFLHHIRITFPGFKAVSLPDWAATRGRGSVLGFGPGVEQALDDVVLAYEVGP